MNTINNESSHCLLQWLLVRVVLNNGCGKQQKCYDNVNGTFTTRAPCQLLYPHSHTYCGFCKMLPVILCVTVSSLSWIWVRCLPNTPNACYSLQCIYFKKCFVSPNYPFLKHLLKSCQVLNLCHDCRNSTV